MQNCCLTGDITPYTPTTDKPWNKKRIQHLYRRIGFGATMARINDGLSMTPEALIDEIVDNAINLPLAAAPEWHNWDYDTYLTANECYYNGQLSNNTRSTIGAEWLYDIAEKENGLRHKMAFFWHNHFVTEYTDYQNNHFLYRYKRLLAEHALGNFKDFCRAIITNEAMLFYLNGQVNAVSNPGDIPNENFAREFYELFTLGPGNYTDDDTAGPINDISETARALSGWAVKRHTFSNGGWTHNWWESPAFFPDRHDDGTKLVFGQTCPAGQGDQDIDWVIDNLFAQKSNEIAEFICTKIYQGLVHPTEIDTDIVASLITVFLDPAHPFEIAPVVRTLLKSEHFFEDCFFGTRAKSPTEFFMSFLVESDTSLLGYPWEDAGQLQNTNELLYSGQGMNINVGDPLSCPIVNVFDFNPAQGEDISDSIFWIRSTYVNRVVWASTQNGQDIFSPPNVGGWDEHYTWLSPSQLLYRWSTLEETITRVSYNQETELLTFMENLAGGSVDPIVITEATMHHFLVNPTQAQITAATDIFKGVNPQAFEEGYWTWNEANAREHVKELLVHICRLPEYQLN